MKSGWVACRITGVLVICLKEARIRDESRQFVHLHVTDSLLFLKLEFEKSISLCERTT